MMNIFVLLSVCFEKEFLCGLINKRFILFFFIEFLEFRN